MPVGQARTRHTRGGSISASDANWDPCNDANETEGVGQYSANPWGFFDMHGNVWEWTVDSYAAQFYKPSGPPRTPTVYMGRFLVRPHAL